MVSVDEVVPMVDQKLEGISSSPTDTSPLCGRI